MYENKVHGKVFAGEFLTGNLQFYSIATATDITGASPTSQKALDKVVEVISLNGQPVIMGAPVLDGGDYVFKFAIEHVGAWGSNSVLEAALLAHAGITAEVTIGETL